LVRDLIQEGGRVVGTPNTLQGMPTLSTSQLEARNNMHCLKKGNKYGCHVCSMKKKLSRTVYACPKYNVGLCVVLCFKIYHMQSTF
jgi:hypothetical protein